MSGGVNSIDAVKKKIKVLQDQAEDAEERAERLQKEVEKEKSSREEVHTHLYRWSRGSVRFSVVPLVFLSCSFWTEADLVLGLVWSYKNL